MNERQFLISGKERREQKKRLAELERFVRMFWFYNDIDEVYGGGMDKEDAEKLLNQKKLEIEILKANLARRFC